ncbi:MAG: MFS transporter [Allosphingosinicella sp.]|uniref:MFS transporter n=1 Tax=Allosphingosinicella sp. TaxID=2823234 RepID=UPI0039275F72
MASEAHSGAAAAGRGEFRLGWKPLSAALLGVACGASPIPFNVLPLVMGPINAEFGWGFLEISLGVTIFGITASLLAPVVGGLADRHGVRPVALTSLFLFAVAFSLFYFTPSNLTGYYLLWLLVGLIGIGSTPVTWSRAINMWFFRNRGLALGIMLLGTSLAGMVVPQIAGRVTEAYGWRMAFPALALLPLLVALPIGLLMFREPRPEERPAGLSDSAGAVLGMTVKETARTYRFWVLLLSIACIALAYGGAHIHMAQIVQLHGFGVGTAASVMGVVALGIMSGRIIVGMLFDRFWAPAVAFPVLVLPAIACFMLMGTSTALMPLVIGGFMLGFAAGAESDVIAYLASRYFGMAHYGKIYGLLYMPFGIFSAISPMVYGGVRDATGSYDLMLMAAAGLFVMGGALLLVLGRYPDWTRPAAAPAPAPGLPEAA